MAWLRSCRGVREAFPTPGPCGGFVGPAAPALGPIDALLCRMGDSNTLLGFGRARAFETPVYGKAKPGLWEPDAETRGRVLEQVGRRCTPDELGEIARSTLGPAKTEADG